MSYRTQMTTGKKLSPFNILVYGLAGLGKTTFALRAPKPLVINLDKGTDEIDAEFHELPEPKSFKEVIAQLDDIISDDEYPNQTLVVDSITKLEPLIFDEVCKEGNKTSITKFGYGEGYKLAVVKWRIFLEKIAVILEQKKWNVILIAHPEVKDVSDPNQQQDFQRWQPRLHKDAMAMIVESVKAVLFAEVETTTIGGGEEQGKARAISEGVRVLRTEFRPSFIAKNRYGLPLTIPLSWDAFEDAAQKGRPDDAAAVVSRIEGLLTQITNQKLIETVKVEVEKVKTNSSRLKEYENKLKTIVSAQEAK